MNALGTIGCGICDDDEEVEATTPGPLYHGVCARCWWESVESGIHDLDELPADLPRSEVI